ncbi:MAG: hypothetical protein K5774_03840 [Clostridia bacterium]|nr:hypothetical protein [Clostridia bacterium]
MEQQELKTISLILRVYAKGHDAETIATALELPVEYVETVLEIADDTDYNVEAVAHRLMNR